MALARRRGTADDDDEGFPHSAREEDSSSYVSPGMEKKREHPSGWHNREEALGGWVGGSGLFGNAVKLFENVGDVVTNIVAPLPEDDESFNLEDSFEQRYGVGQRGNGDDSHEEYAGEEKQKVENDGDEVDDDNTLKMKVEQPKNMVSPPLPASTTAPISAPPSREDSLLPLSAPAVDPKFLQSREVASGASVSLPERHNLLNDSVEYLGNVSIDLDTTPDKGRTETGVASRQPHTANDDADSTERAHIPGQSSMGKVVEEGAADNRDRDRRLQDKYLQGMEHRLAQSESALSKKDQELRAMKEQLARSSDALERQREHHSREMADVESKLHMAELTAQERSRALERVSTMGGVNSEQSDSFRKAMEEQDAEIMKLQGYLQESEDRLKEHEEMLWASKAEQSELLFALEVEKKATEKAVAAKEALQADGEAMREELGRLRSSLAAAGASCTGDVGGGKEGEQEEGDKEDGDRDRDRDGDGDVDRNGVEEAPEAVSSGSKDDADVDVASAVVEGTNTGAGYERQQVRRLELRVAALQEELSAAVSNAKLAGDGLLIERNDKDDAIASAARAEKALRESEKEQEQLHVVIAQLRSAKRSQSEQCEGLESENKELREKVGKLQQAWTRDTQQLSKVSRMAEEEGSERGRLHAALHASQSSVDELESALAETRAKMSALEKENYELTVHCDVLQSDQKLQEQELQQRTLEVGNLHSAFAALQREKDKQTSRLMEEAAAAREEEEEERQQALDNARRRWVEDTQDLKEELAEALKRVEDEGLLRRKAQLDLSNEKKAMQKSLEGAVAQLRNGQAEVVDRTLIANLVVQYFQKGYRKDILVLISKVLDFDEEQMVSVGLAVPKINLVKSLVDGLKRVAATPTDQVDPESLQGDNIAELWVSFLNAEAGIDSDFPAGTGAGAGTGTGAGAGVLGEKERTSSFSVEGIEGGGGGPSSPRPARSRPAPSISTVPTK